MRCRFTGRRRRTCRRKPLNPSRNWESYLLVETWWTLHRTAKSRNLLIEFLEFQWSQVRWQSQSLLKRNWLVGSTCPATRMKNSPSRERSFKLLVMIPTFCFNYCFIWLSKDVCSCFKDVTHVPRMYVIATRIENSNSVILLLMCNL